MEAVPFDIGMRAMKSASRIVYFGGRPPSFPSTIANLYDSFNMVESVPKLRLGERTEHIHAFILQRINFYYTHSLEYCTCWLTLCYKVNHFITL